LFIVEAVQKVGIYKNDLVIKPAGGGENIEKPLALSVVRD
jgi:hypothetical protein